MKVAEPRGMATTSDAAEFLNVTTRTIQNWIANGTLASKKLGRCRRIPWTVLKRMAAPDRR